MSDLSNAGDALMSSPVLLSVLSSIGFPDRSLRTVSSMVYSSSSLAVFLTSCNFDSPMKHVSAIRMSVLREFVESFFFGRR